MATFDTYSSPPAHLAYSHDFFAMLTFKNVAEMEYPTIAPPKSLISWTFSNCIPTNALATIIAPREVLPHTEDLLPITKEMQTAFALGSRSIVVTIAVGENELTTEYHFSKVSVNITRLLWYTHTRHERYA
jgi:hypothetical protein